MPPIPPPLLPNIGTLYPAGGDAPLGNLPPTFTQPGGPGTPVFPQLTDSAAGQFEPPTTPTGMYTYLCLHTFNCPRVFKQFDPLTGQDAAIICCPVCGLIQDIIIPYDSFLNYIQNPILVSG
jgi:hypothetical protein